MLITARQRFLNGMAVPACRTQFEMKMVFEKSKNVHISKYL